MTRAALLSLAFALPILAACGGPTPTPTPAATATPVAGKPRLTALQPVVEFHPRELDAGQNLEADATIEVEPGANIITREGGRARLVWDDFLIHDLLTDTDTLVSLSKPDLRYAVLDQATGTGRYLLVGPGEPATLTVKAGWIEIGVAEGEADFVVSLVPGTEPSAWLAMLQGQAVVRRGAGDEAPVTLSAGKAAGFSERGAMPEGMDVDVGLIKAWYDDVAKGEAETSIVAVAYRCKVVVDAATLRQSASADAAPVGGPLAKDTVVGVLQRDEAGQWLRVKPLAKPDVGWAAVTDLSCSGPVASVSTTLPGELTAPTATLARPTRLLAPATRGTPTILPLATPTRTATAAAAEISFSADDDDINEGDCTTLRWTVKNVREYYVEGEGQTGDSGSMRVCPRSTESFSLRAVRRDGVEESRSVTVRVRPRAQPTAVPTNPPAQPTNTSAPPPGPTNTSPPAASDTPVPAPSDTPQPFATDTPPSP